MQWDGSPSGGFSAGTPWLPPVDPERRNVEAQRDDPASMLSFVRELIALRRRARRGLRAARLRPGRDRVQARRATWWPSTWPRSREPRRRSSARSRSRRASARSMTESLRRAPPSSRLIESPSPGVGSPQEEGEVLHGRHAIAVLAVLATAALAACGSSEGGSGARAINWYVFNEPGGAYDAAVADCNKQAGGKYTINYVKLPTDANQQRELIVRRLAAEDDTHRPRRHGRDLDRRARRGRLDPAVGGRAPRRRGEGQARGPAQDRGVQGQGLGDPVHEQHAAALVPQGPGRRRRPRTSPGTR